MSFHITCILHSFFFLSRGSTDEYRPQSPSKDAGKSENRGAHTHNEDDKANILKGIAGQPESFGRFLMSHS